MSACRPVLCEACAGLVCAHLFTELLSGSSLTSPQVLRLQQVPRTDTRFPGAWFRIPTVVDVARHSGAPLSGAAVLHLVVSESHSPPPRMVLHGAHHGLLVSVGGDRSATVPVTPQKEISNEPMPTPPRPQRQYWIGGLLAMHPHCVLVWSSILCFSCSPKSSGCWSCNHDSTLHQNRAVFCFRSVFLAVGLRLAHSTSIQVYDLPRWVLRLRDTGARVVLSPTQVGTRSGLACCCPSGIYMIHRWPTKLVHATQSHLHKYTNPQAHILRHSNSNTHTYTHTHTHTPLQQRHCLLL